MREHTKAQEKNKNYKLIPNHWPLHLHPNNESTARIKSHPLSLGNIREPVFLIFPGE